jgi:ABC-2 type transport system permease protein
MLPKPLLIISHFNPLSYLVSGIRYSMTGISDVPPMVAAAVTFSMAGLFFIATVYLFKIGYKLRT